MVKQICLFSMTKKLDCLMRLNYIFFHISLHERKNTWKSLFQLNTWRYFILFSSELKISCNHTRSTRLRKILSYYILKNSIFEMFWFHVQSLWYINIIFFILLATSEIWLRTWKYHCYCMNVVCIYIFHEYWWCMKYMYV